MLGPEDAAKVCCGAGLRVWLKRSFRSQCFNRCSAAVSQKRPCPVTCASLSGALWLSAMLKDGVPVRRGSAALQPAGRPNSGSSAFYRLTLGSFPSSCCCSFASARVETSFRHDTVSSLSLSLCLHGPRHRSCFPGPDILSRFLPPAELRFDGSVPSSSRIGFRSSSG